MNNYRDVIKAPIITEKSSTIQTNNNTYTFKVANDANKTQIKQAIEAIFKVKVLNVTTVNVRAKYKKVGKYAGTTAKYKKAYVKLEEGNKIEF
jgi:large subunit ribosomal protein L23